MIAGRIARRMLAAPRTQPEEASLGPALDRLGGEVARIRSRDGLRLSARWLGAEPGDPGWDPDPHEAIVVLHGYSGSVAPDLVEYGPTLRRTAGVLGLDFRGHGQSDPAETTFGLREVEDVGGALAWLGERGIHRVALFGTSMGGITAIAAAVVLGGRRPRGRRRRSGRPTPHLSGTPAADRRDRGRGRHRRAADRRANRLSGPGPVRRWLSRRAFAIAATWLGRTRAPPSRSGSWGSSRISRSS